MDQLVRSQTDKMIGGVCGGLGRYFEIDPVIVRLLFVLLGFAGPGVPLYFVLWLVMPSPKRIGAPTGQPSPSDPTSYRYDPYTGQPINQSAARVGEPAQPTYTSTGPTIDLERGVQQQPVTPPPATGWQAPPVTPQPVRQPATRDQRRTQLGWVLLGIGVLVMAAEMEVAGLLLPVILIAGGYMLYKRS